MGKRILLLFAVFLMTASIGFTQNIDPASVNVSELSETQITKMKEEIAKRGLTIDQALVLAKQRGASETQVSELRMRLSGMGGTSTNASSSSSTISSNNSSDNKTESYNQEENANALRKEKRDNAEDEELRKIFGASLFLAKDVTFTPSGIVNASDDYILSIEDEVTIQIWGDAQATYQLRVNTSGAILIPDLGPVYVKGKTFKNAVRTIKQMLIGIYSGMKGPNPTIFSDVALSWQHDIKIIVMGDAVTPGTFTLPANSTAFNALYASGGPNMSGSFRDVRVVRNNKIIAHLDLYDFLVNGTINEDVQLRDNDVIYIPGYISRVELTGAFRKPMKYELLEGEHFNHLLKYSGGFAENAFTSKVKVERIVDGEKEIQVIDSIAYNSFALTNGDVINSGKVLNKYKNKVVIKGAVFRPGAYQLKDEMQLSSLIKEASGLRDDAYLDRGFLTRKRDNMEMENISFGLFSVLNGDSDVTLRSDDVITIRSRFEMQEIKNVSVFGELNNPGEYPYVDNMTLQDLIVRAGGFTRDADVSFIEVARSLTNKEAAVLSDTISHYYSFSVDRDLRLSSEGKGFVLEPFDVVYIRRAPGRRKFGSIKLRGEVMYAGDYSIISKKDHISDIIKRAGGVTPDAFVNGAMLIRKTQLSDIELERLQDLAKDEEIDVKVERERTEIVGINLDKILSTPHGPLDILVQPGDEIKIPKNMETVRISGNVMNPIASVYKKGLTVKKYINKSGGFGERSRRSKVYVIYANGTTAVTKNFLLFKNYPRVEPGAEIIVPRKPIKQDQTTKWISIGSSVASLAVAIATVVNLTNK
ncbi:SLBB domain-containing protein [Halosquirtibacter xylanolyticus]|uniref:polysaccharide biosynthesis/export family protein n=1 Tax=Halosquirtibacter xylanolyticus TaxID=3374599 RepID=UPI003748DC8E|nr:SLBB domain-containing protein [Prolixibacteraceae bacterium]